MAWQAQRYSRGRCAGPGLALVHHRLRSVASDSAAPLRTGGTIENPGDTCASPCLDPFVMYTNNGRPDVFANRSGFGIGLTALDDVFRVHAQTHQTAMATGPRMQYMGMDCPVSDPPAISLAEPSFGMASTGDEYTLEWAIYPFVSASAAEGERGEGGQASAVHGPSNTVLLPLLQDSLARSSIQHLRDELSVFIGGPPRPFLASFSVVLARVCLRVRTAWRSKGGC